MSKDKKPQSYAEWSFISPPRFSSYSEAIPERELGWSRWSLPTAESALAGDWIARESAKTRQSGLPAEWISLRWGSSHAPPRAWMDAQGWTPEEERAWMVRWCAFLENCFLHVSPSDGSLLAYTASPDHGLANRQTVMRPGRWLVKHFPWFSPQDVKELCLEWTLIGTPPEIRFAVSADDIFNVYRDGPHSCMAGHKSVRAYAGGDLAIAYFRNARGRIAARTLVWPERKLYFAGAYGDDTRLYMGLEAVGYSEDVDELAGARLGGYEDARGRPMAPYVDACEGRAHYNAKRELVLGSGAGEEVELRSTAGELRPALSCDRCGDARTEDEGVYLEDEDEMWCQYCADNYAVWCTQCDTTVSEDNAQEVRTIRCSETWCDRCVSDGDAYSCYDCGGTFHIDRMCGDYCDGCGIVCDQCCEGVSKDDVTRHEGESLCEDCAETRKEEEEETDNDEDEEEVNAA